MAAADVELATVAHGEARIEWAERQMPVLRRVRERFARERPLAGVTVGACMHVTSETANLVRALLAGGAEVALCAGNPLSTQDDAAAALAAGGAEVHAVRGEDVETYYADIEAVVERGPRVAIDDGGDLISRLHAGGATGVVGATEATKTGVARLKALEVEGLLAFPAIAVGEASVRHLYDNLHGTGQSTLDGILRATNMLLAGSRVVVLGYGLAGRAIAARARAGGAQVFVCEVDPLRALEAATAGNAVMPSLEAAALGDLFITVTGGRDVLRGPHFERMRDGAVLANAGHFDVEIARPELEAMTHELRQPRPHVAEHVLADGRRLNLLADGRVVNLAAGEGHPAAVMDVAFACQALCVEHLVRSAGALAPRVHQLPPEIDRSVAELKLDSLGVRIDALSADQLAYLAAWDQGT